MRRYRQIGLAMALVLLAGCGDPARQDQVAAERGSVRVEKAPSRGPFVRVLGTAQDGGLPHVACSCERCDLARQDPRQARLITSLALVLPRVEKVYLFDVSPDIRQQIDLLEDVRAAPPARVDRNAVDGVFLTHAHMGHYTGLAFFGYEAMHATGIPTFVSPRMAGFLTNNGPWSQLVDLNNISLRIVAAGATVELEESVSVSVFVAPHRDEYADTLGFVITGPSKSLLYLPDTDSWAVWQPPVTDLLREIDVALIDGTFFSADELPGRRVESIGHPLIPHSMDLLEPLVSSGELRVLFTHLNHSNPAVIASGEAHATIERRGFQVLTEGEEFDL